MNIKKINENLWRFYFFRENGKDYCFDCFTHKLFSLSTDLKSLLEAGDYKKIKHDYKKFYKSILCKDIFKPEILQENKCCITINFSNNCNLNCSYCYRNKAEKSKLEMNDAERILQFALAEYMPDAESYSFTGCMTSESSFDLDYLKAFDSAIAKYEGYLFSSETLSENDAETLFFKLPKAIFSKYSDGTLSFVGRLNQILYNEKLWKIYDYSENEYLSAMLKTTDVLSVSKTVTANRQILNKEFKDYNLETKIKNISMWFMTNGSHITDEYISFLKSIYMDTVMVSIDGKEEIHNKARKYHDGNGSFSDVLAGIKKLQNAGIKVTASVVITPENPYLLETVEYLMSLGMEKVSFNLARGRAVSAQFSKQSMDFLIDDFRKIYEKVYIEIISGNFHLLPALKDTMLFSCIKKIYYRAYLTSRCHWGKEVVIDSKGNMYHCNSTIGCSNDLLGNYRNHVTYKDVNTLKNVDDYERCKKCFAKYLCGGTCYAEEIVGNKNNFDMECYYRKELIKIGMEFYARLFSNNLLDDFIKAAA